MVFESVVTDVLNKILGDYVENLDKKQLKIGIWGGDVVLHNLKLRDNALDEIDLPLQLVYGYLGKLVLKIPWKNLYSQPVVAQIEDFYLLISPKQSVQYDPEKEQKYDFQTKQAALQALEDAQKKELDKDKAKPDASFAEKLTAQIVNNLQAKIANVHIRYEDTTTAGKPFAFGATLHDLELYTTDCNWDKCYLTEQVSRVFKLAKLDSLAVYMNCDAVLFSEYGKEQLSEEFRKNIAQRDLTPAEYHYIVGPISSTAKLQLNMNPEYDDPPFELPKIDLCLELEKLNVGVTSTQFQYTLKLADSLNRQQLAAPYIKYRPFNIPYKNHAKEWWRFAITAILEETIRKKNRAWTWEYMKEHRELCNTYAETFREKELCKKPPATLTETCTLLEQRLDLFNLLLIRQRVKIDVDKHKKEEELKTSQKGGWFGGWFGGGAKNANDEPSDLVHKLEAAMTAEERLKLNKAIGYEENMAPQHMPEHYEAIKMNFKLEALEIGLYDDSTVPLSQKGTSSYDLSSLQTIMLLKLSMATCSLQQRPAASAISLTAGMKELRLTGLKKPDFTPTLIESKVTDEFNLIDVFFETNPLDKQCDQRVKVLARPLQIIYDSDTVLHLVKVFSPPKTVNLSELTETAAERMSNFKERTATGMQYMIANHSFIEVDITLMPNVLIVPSTGTYVAGQNSLLVLSLGQFQITSQPQKQRSLDVSSIFNMDKDQDEIFKNIMEQAYDKFNIVLDDVQLLVVKPHESWEEILKQATMSEMHVLRPTSLIITANLCVVGDDPRLPKNKVDILMPSIHVNFTEDRVLEALKVVRSLPLPESEVAEPSVIIKALSVASKHSLSRILNLDVRRLKPEKSTSLTTEIVQYTNLEVNFTLKEFKVQMYKSCILARTCEEDSPEDSANYGTPVEDMPHATVTFSDSTTHLYGEPLAEGQMILSLQILQLEACMSQRTYELVATAKLGAINLTKYDIYEEKGISVIDTPRFSEELKYLLTISYTMADKTSPEFTTKYNSTEQLILVNFSTLHITLHQESLQHLMEIADTLQRKLGLVSGPPTPKDRIALAGGDNIVNKMATILEEDAELVADTVMPERRRTRASKVVNSIKINVVANMEQVALFLTCHKRPLASMKVEHFNAGIILKSSYTQLNLTLRDIIVTDLNPKSIHNSILCIVGNNALDCQVVMFNLDETADYNSDDMKISVEIGCVKIVFLNWFVTSVLNFLNNFQAAQQALANAGAAAADAAKQNALDAYTKATRMKLNIKIKAPIIVVPEDSQSFVGLALDLGQLMLSNTTTEVNVPNHDRSPAVLDEIRLELKDMKLSKVTILDDEKNKESISIMNSLDTLDATYGVKSKVNIMDPISFALNVKRNLSSAWYKNVPEMDVSGRLKFIEFNLYMEDYALIMSILNRNLNEGAHEFPPVETVVVPETPSSTVVDVQRRSLQADRPQMESRSPSRRGTGKAKEASQQQNIYEQLKFNFQFDGVIANLMMKNDEGLSRFGLYYLSVKGSKLIDGTLSTSVVLCNIQIDDTRPNTKSKITKYLCRKDWKSKMPQTASPAEVENILEDCYDDRNYMLDLTASIKENDTFAEVRVCGFDLILCIDYLLKLADFFQLPETAAPPQPETANVVEFAPKVAAGKPATRPNTPPPELVSEEKKMNLILHIEEPDIILIESLEDINSNAIIFNAQGKVNYRTVGDKQLINGQIDSLKMYMCSFMPERREATRHYIIHPCVISLQGSTPEEEGLHISLKLSEIIINVSPATIELFNKAMLTISANSAEKAAEQKQVSDHTDIWTEQNFKDCDHWFVKADQAEDVLEVLESMEIVPLGKRKTEKCIVEVPCITLVVETGIGYYTTPLLSFDTRLNAVVSDWSRDLSIKGSLSLNMNYYNLALGAWEPIIELNEHTTQSGQHEYLPWELAFSLAIESKKSEFDEDVEEKTTKITVNAEQNLEMTVSKTCLDLLGVLGEAFSQAIDAKGLIKPEVIAPYVVENDTGFDISINFQRGIFTLHECHMPNLSKTNTINRSIIFQTDATTPNFTPEHVKNCTISAGGRAFLQTKDLSTATCEEDEEYNIYVKVGGINKELVLPVSRSDKRYFPLYRDKNQDPWGIVSEVHSEYGTTTVNIHGVVSVYNHFTVSVQVYRNKAQSYEKILVGDIAPHETFHVPLHAIYSDTKNLYFAVEGYNVSVQGIQWSDSPTDLHYVRQIQCDPIQTFETLHMRVERQKIEIFQEHTNKYKLLSAFYTLHLRPPLYLRNALPISIRVSVAGCSVQKELNSKPESVDGEFRKSIVKEELLDYGEKEVLPGDILHLPTFKFSVKGKENRSYLVVRLIQYLEKDWSCTTEIPEEREENTLNTWKFTSYDSAAKMDMDLCVRFENRYCSSEATLYSPFWMINKTGLMLSYKTDTETVEVLYHPPEYDGPILFSFREKFFFDKKRASVRVDNGEWSNTIPLDVAGSIGEIICKSNDLSYQIGVHNHLTYNSLTKVITFIPFYIATNKCEFSIELQEQSRPGDPWIKVEPNGCVPIWPKNDSDNMIVAKVDGQCSVPFKYSEVQCTLLQLRENRHGGINVDVQTTEGGVYINFSEYKYGDAPGLLINHTTKAITYYEKGEKKKERTLEPHQKVLYTWLDPIGEKVIVFGKNNAESDLRRDGVGELILYDNTKAYWVSFLDGLQRILLFTEIESIATKSETSATLRTVTQSIEVRIHGIGLSVINNLTGIDILYLGITSSGIIWEYKKENKKRFKQMNIHDTSQVEAQYQAYQLDKGVNQVKTYFLDGKHQLDFATMTMHKSSKRNILRTFYPGVYVLLNTSPFQTQLHAKINKIQIDNQLTDCIFPVVLAPIPPPKSVATTTVLKPFIECSIVERVVPNSTVKQFKYATMLIQEFHFKVDLLFLTGIAELFSGKTTDEQAAKLFNDDCNSIKKPLSDLVQTHSMLEQKNFYDNLHLGPLKIHVSFSMAGSDTTALPGILSTLVQGVGVTLTDVNDVVFRLAFFQREYQFFTQRQLTSEITAHYTGQALKQLYVLVLGLDVLGNPYGLVVGFKKGVEDLFYEPFQGAIQGPGEFAEGLVLGVKSLFGHTVGGAAEAVSKITGAMGKGLAVLTFDDDYQKKRRQAMNRKPANFQEGIARSSKSLVMGFVDGVSGVVRKPFTGAREEGVEGFFKGLGKGAIGLVARPTAGVVDFASGSFDAVKRATETHEDIKRLRPPRYLYQDNILRPYCMADAQGNKMLKEIEKGKYAATDSFVHCEEVVQKSEFAIVSNHRVIYVSKNDLFGTWTVQWAYLWGEIVSIHSTDRGVEVTLRKEGKRVMGMFTSHEVQRKLILIPHKTRRDNLAELMESQRKDA